MENKNARAVLKPPSLFISSIHLTGVQANNYSKSVQKCCLKNAIYLMTLRKFLKLPNLKLI